VWVGISRAHALRDSFEAEAGAEPAGCFSLINQAVAGVVVGGQPGPRSAAAAASAARAEAAGPGAALQRQHHRRRSPRPSRREQQLRQRSG
jgi:hypothetical protein